MIWFQYTPLTSWGEEHQHAVPYLHAQNFDNRCALIGSIISPMTKSDNTFNRIKIYIYIYIYIFIYVYTYMCIITFMIWYTICGMTEYMGTRASSPASTIMAGWVAGQAGPRHHSYSYMEEKSTTKEIGPK